MGHDRLMTNKFILESFWQKAANCASIALIKAAVLRYGLRRSFQVRRRNENLIITLQDRRMLVLTEKEIRAINRENKILYSPYRDPSKKRALIKLREFAETAFAIMVRSIQLEGYEGKEHTQSSAIRLLTRTGISTAQLHRLLGFSRKSVAAHKLAQKHLSLFNRKNGVLLYSDLHIVVVSKGYYEDFGKAITLEGKIPLLKGKKAKYWFELQ